MKASGAKDDMNKETLEEEGEGRKTTCPSDWLNKPRPLSMKQRKLSVSQLP